MIYHKSLIIVLLGLFSAPIFAADLVLLKRVPFYEFMQHKVTVKIPLSIPVPTEYEPAKAVSQASDSYWMRSTDAAQAEITHDLPSSNGFMLAFPTTNVGYDRRKNKFIGTSEESEWVAEEKAKGFELESMERLLAGSYPVLLMRDRQISNGKLIYMMYIALNVDTATVCISYRPPGNSREVGDFVWEAFRQAVKEVK